RDANRDVDGEQSVDDGGRQGQDHQRDDRDQQDGDAGFADAWQLDCFEHVHYSVVAGWIERPWTQRRIAATTSKSSSGIGSFSGILCSIRAPGGLATTGTHTPGA